MESGGVSSHYHLEVLLQKYPSPVIVRTMDYSIAFVDQMAPHLRSLRKARGLTQVALAQRLGVTQSRVSAIERNPSVMSVEQLCGVLRALDAQLVLRDGLATRREGTLSTPASPEGKGTASAVLGNDESDWPQGVW
jgi:transcriptional regulator with XRE-family HTH domain